MNIVDGSLSFDFENSCLVLENRVNATLNSTYIDCAEQVTMARCYTRRWTRSLRAGERTSEQGSEDLESVSWYCLLDYKATQAISPQQSAYYDPFQRRGGFWFCDMNN
jgi:hypothetical protein